MDTRTGLVITGGHAPAGNVVIGERSRCFVVAADSGLEFARRHDIQPDAIVGDMDSLSDQSLLLRYDQALIHRHDRLKDLTDTELALEMIWKQSLKEVTILGGGGGRLDHLLAIYSLFERRPAPSRWVTDREEVVLVRHAVEFDATPGEVVSFFPVGPEPATMTSAGLRWPLDGLSWQHGDVGVSNECVEETCKVEMRSGRLIMVRTLPQHVRLP